MKLTFEDLEYLSPTIASLNACGIFNSYNFSTTNSAQMMIFPIAEFVVQF